MIGDTARCLRGDVLRDRHGLHGLERCWVRSGEAAAHALIDWTIPRENAVLSECALLTTPWRKTIQMLEPEFTARNPWLTHITFTFQQLINIIVAVL